MPNTQKKKPARRSVYDAIVAEALQDTLQKSRVTAPGDPTGGQKMPFRQDRQPRNKEKDGTNYMAIFDREAQESDDQLDDWMKYTNAVTGSPEDFVNDDDDAPADPDEADEDSRGNPEYNPYSDDDQDDAVIDLTDGEYTKVRAHKRRLRKSRGDHDAEYDALSDDDEDAEDPEDDLEEDGDDAATQQAKKVKQAARQSTKKGIKKSQPNDDDDLDEDDDDPDHNTEDEDEDTTHTAANKAERERLAKGRQRSMKKALGRDALELVDGNVFAKALADAVWDLRDDLVAEVRTTNLAWRKQNRALAQRVGQLEDKIHKALQGELQQVTKSLAGALAVRPANDPTLDLTEPVRKGYGAPVQTRKKYGTGFNADRALDLMEKSWRGDPETPIKDTDLTLMDGNRSPEGLSPGAVQFLAQNGLL